MAHAAAVYLRQLLEEELMQFLCRTLEFEESQVNDFRLRVNDVLEKFKTPTCLSPMAEIQEYFRDLAPTTIDVDLINEASLFDKVLSNDRNVLDRIPYIMYQLDGINSSLENFVGHPISSSVNGDSSPILAEHSFMEFANNLLFLNREYQEVVSLLNAVAEGANSLHDMLDTMLLKVEDSNDHHPDMNLILGHIIDEIEDFLTGYPFSMKKINVVALSRVKQIIFCILEDLLLGCESESKSESLPRPKLQRSQGWLRKWQQLFCIRGAEHEEEDDIDTSLKEYSQLDSFSEGSSKSSSKREEIVMGLDDDITKLVDELTGPWPALSMVTIAGMGGIGKTTLAQKLFRHPSIVYHFHFTTWVNSISSIDQVLSHLLLSLRLICGEIEGQKSEENSEFIPDETRGQSSEEKCEILWRSLRKRRYLIVVDDLWNFDAWNAIERCFPDDRVGSRILITSRSMEFPTHIPKIPPHLMRLLDENQSWKLLKRLVFGEEMSCPLDLEIVGKVIARKCGGLPLAIAVIAGTLLSIPKSYSSWKSVMDSVKSIEQCLDILALSYNYSPQHLKTCFLFMGSFPANCEIDAQKLFNLWLAGGFLESKSSSIPSEKLAEEYLEELICRCLVLVGQRSLNGKIKTCSIHDLVRQLCLGKAYKEDFMQVLPEAEGTTGQGKENQRHLIFNSMNDADLLSLPSLPHLRSFILLTPGFDVSQDVLVCLLSHYKWLRVLDIYFFPLGVFPVEILDLVNLRYLALNITYVLDASLSRLWKLQSLVVYGPWIPMVGRKLEYMPTLVFDYWKMPWLRNVIVRVPSHFRYHHLPPRLLDRDAFPSNLQTLSTITFSSCREEVILLMPKLKKLGVYETKQDYENREYERFFENLRSLSELELLKCSFHGGGNEKATTRSLDLHGVLPYNLKKLTLRGSCLSWDKMELLASLPKLETLKLKDYAFRGLAWDLNEEVVFGHLKQLLIDKTDLVSWEAEGTDHFPCLDRLVLRSCKSLYKIPFQAFTSLELIDVHNCNPSVENSAKEFQGLYGSLEVAETDRTRVVEKGGQFMEYQH